MATPFQMSREQCANFVTSTHPPFKGCIFGGPSWKEGECALQKPGTQCAYFEKAVLPLVDPEWRMPQYAGVRDQYMFDVRIADKRTTKARRTEKCSG